MKIRFSLCIYTDQSAWLLAHYDQYRDLLHWKLSVVATVNGIKKWPEYIITHFGRNFFSYLIGDLEENISKTHRHVNSMGNTGLLICQGLHWMQLREKVSDWTLQVDHKVLVYYMQLISSPLLKEFK